jgi:hypothetical protein
MKESNSCSCFFTSLHCNKKATPVWNGFQIVLRIFYTIPAAFATIITITLTRAEMVVFVFIFFLNRNKCMEKQVQKANLFSLFIFLKKCCQVRK